MSFYLFLPPCRCLLQQQRPDELSQTLCITRRVRGVDRRVRLQESNVQPEAALRLPRCGLKSPRSVVSNCNSQMSFVDLVNKKIGNKILLKESLTWRNGMWLNVYTHTHIFSPPCVKAPFSPDPLITVENKNVSRQWWSRFSNRSFFYPQYLNSYWIDPQLHY